MVFSCFVTFVLSLPLLTPVAVEAAPNRAAIPAIGAPTGAPIPVKKLAKLADDNTTVNTPVAAANVLIIVFTRLYFLLIFYGNEKFHSRVSFDNHYSFLIYNPPHFPLVRDRAEVRLELYFVQTF